MNTLSLLLLYRHITQQSSGVPKNKIMVGLPLYAHTWYVPGLQGDAWQQFGQPAKVQGECCETFKQTYGAKPGKYIVKPLSHRYLVKAGVPLLDAAHHCAVTGVTALRPCHTPREKE